MSTTQIDIKKLVVKMKDIDGLSYSSISKKLKEDYNIERTRQAICSMYKRAKEIEEYEDDSMIKDIITMHAYGYSCNEIFEILNKNNIDIKKYRVFEIVRDNRYLVDDKIKSINSIIRSNMNSLNETKKLLEYKGYVPKTKLICKIVNDIEEERISEFRSAIYNEMIKAYGSEVDMFIKK